MKKMQHLARNKGSFPLHSRSAPDLPPLLTLSKADQLKQAEEVNRLLKVDLSLDELQNFETTPPPKKMKPGISEKPEGSLTLEGPTEDTTSPSSCVKYSASQKLVFQQHRKILEDLAYQNSAQDSGLLELLLSTAKDDEDENILGLPLLLD